MNHSIVRYILGVVLKIEGGLLLLPCIISVIYQEQVGLYYLATGIVTFLIGFVISMKKPLQNLFSLREGCFSTALSWIVMSLVGAIPFFAAGEIPNYLDAVFETASGFTTTGASILTDVEALSHTALFWRSFTHWIGGMGVLVFLLAVIPMSGGGSINLMRAESPGPSVGKLVPKMKDSARILYYIYLGMTGIEFLFLALGGMPIFDSITITFGTAGTGGFGVLNSSCAAYTPYQQWVITIFMILFGVNFNVYFLLLFRKFKEAFSSEEVKWYFLIIGVSTAAIAAQLIYHAVAAGEAIRGALFQVASVMTTTGFATMDFNTWGTTSKVIMVLIMMIGACAGSTGGGIKVSRILLLLKSVKKEMVSFVHPKSVRKIMLDKKVVEHEVIRSTNVFFATYAMIFIISLIFISFEGRDLITSFTSVAATLGNVGPGLGDVGPTGNYAFFHPFSKIVLIFDMIAGRLELFPMLMLFSPVAWKVGILHKKKEFLAKKG
ncbi:MAG: TrkH family potassium uptake protein [Lachnospiraceae bacterium]|nr:TrkH family potassium uptake protein [Lachnospiraceae bacterium]